ncbi:MAG: glycosyltransferase family 4 protein [Bacteroidales bacterium]
MGISKQINKSILFVHQGFELYGSDKMLLLNIKAAIIKYPEKKIIVILPKKGILSEILENEYKVEVLIRHLGVVRKYDLKRFNLSAFTRIFTFFRLLAFINSFEFVYINSIVIIDYILAARFAKVKAFIHVHELPLGIAAKIFSSLLSFSSANLIFISAASKNAFINLKNKHQFIVWNGVEQLKETVREKENAVRIKILLIGRINSWKGQSLLIKAIALLNETEREKVEIQIVGDVFMHQQELKTNLIEQIKGNKLQQFIKILPFTSSPEMFYNWADIVVVPSLLPEPFGLVAIEAMSLGKLVIAANHGGLKEIIDDKVNGLLFDAGNEKELVDKIAYSINTPDTICELGEKGRQTYKENFTEEIFINKMLEVI